MASSSETRQACDRCHGKKLRCTRQADSDKCARCAKASTDCVFSPIARPYRLPHTSASASSSSGAPSDLGSDWFAGYPTRSQLNGNGLTGTGQDAQQGIVALPQVITTLDTIWRNMPPADACHVSLQDIGQYLEYIAGASFVGSVLDQVLSTAQQLKHMYSAANKDTVATENVNAGQHCTTDNCVHLHPSIEKSSSNLVDHAALTLMAACHLRLLDILGNIAKHGKLCSEMANAMPVEERPQFPLPHMQMGSFVVPQEKMAGMIISMLVDQQQGLIKAATQHGEILKKITTMTDTSLRNMLGVQNAVVLERATVVLNDFTAMGDVFSTLDLFGSGNS